MPAIPADSDEAKYRQFVVHYSRMPGSPSADSATGQDHDLDHEDCCQHDGPARTPAAAEAEHPDAVFPAPPQPAALVVHDPLLLPVGRGHTDVFAAMPLGLLNSSFAGVAPPAATITATKLPPILSPLPVILPDDLVMNYLLGAYMSRQYQHQPVSIKAELSQELKAGLLPDYVLLSMLLWAARWDHELLDLVGPERRAAVMHSLLARVTATLLPSLEIALAGFHAMTDPRLNEDDVDPFAIGPAKNSREAYIRTVVYCLISLFHLMGIAMACPAPADATLGGQTPCSLSSASAAGSFDTFHSIVDLIIRVTKASLILDPRVSARRLPALLAPESGLADSCNGVGYFSVWFERAKRVFAATIVHDYFFSAIYGGDPLVSSESYPWVRGFLQEDEIEQAKVLFGLQERKGKGVVGKGPTSHPDTPFPSEASLSGMSESPDQQDIMLSASFWLPNLGTPNAFAYYPSVAIRLSQLASLAEKYRRRVPDRPYLPRPGKLHVEGQLRQFWAELPASFGGILPLALAVKDNFSSPQGIAVGTQLHLMLEYHAILASLSCPADAVFWSGIPDREWLSSPAFLNALEHSIRVTELLIPLIEGPTTLPQMALPTFQWSIALTGLVRFYFLASLLGHLQTGLVSDVDVATVEIARTQFMIHDAAIRKAQGGIGVGERRSWWFDAWCATTGLPATYGLLEA